jgi:small nuclear ribonucleoprotein (snRNP)-like protein
VDRLYISSISVNQGIGVPALSEKERRMYTRTKQLAISIILLSSFLLSSLTLAAQDNTSDWARLNSLTAGSKLSVELKNGTTVKGKLSSVSDALLTLTVKNAPMELRREDVLSVHQIVKKSAAKSTLIGLGVGAGAGAAIGIAADASSNDNGFEKIDNVAAGAVTVLGAAAGALTGFFIGRGSSKRVLIYQAK